MLRFGNKEFRNIQEQVEKNAKDIETIIEGGGSGGLIVDKPTVDGQILTGNTDGTLEWSTDTINEFQHELVSGENIKTINGNSILGSGDIQIGEGGTIDLSDYYTKTETNNKFALSSDLELTINSTNTNRYNLNLVKKGALKYKSLANKTFTFDSIPTGVITFDQWFNYSVIFNSNATDYTSISIFMNETVVQIKFGSTIVYRTSSGWTNSAYKTVSFSGGTDIANNDLITILQGLGSFANSGEEDVVVDSEFSLISTNPVENKVIKQKFDWVDEQINENFQAIGSLTTNLTDNYYTKTKANNKFATLESMSATDEDIAELNGRITALENAGGTGQTTQVFRGEDTIGLLNIDRTTATGILIIDCHVKDEETASSMFQLVAPVYDYEQEDYVAQTIVRANLADTFLVCKVRLTFDASSNKVRFVANNCIVNSIYWCK